MAARKVCPKVFSNFRSLIGNAPSVLTISLMLAASPVAAADMTFDIPSQALSDALVTFSRQSDIDVAAPFTLVKGKKAPAVHGSMSPEDALAQLLDGSGLRAAKNRDG